MQIIDRRLNPGGKSLPNRQRFLRRARALVREAVRNASSGRGITETEQGAEISIPLHGTEEPSFRPASSGGARDHVLPGNKHYVEGDEIPRPQGGSGGGGREGARDGGGEDSFRFVLSAEEFLDLFLEDLELPDLEKRKLVEEADPSFRRAGYAVSGSPANLAVVRTLRNSLSRRLALRRPKPEAMAALQQQIEEAREQEADRLPLLEEEMARLLRRTQRIPYVDPIDVRYRRFEPQPRPTAQAVMFCLMDVSGSMTEDMKDLAKRFYALLHIFLRKRYKQVDVVFIRHTHEAEEVDEQTFFGSPETGGTIVSTALEEMRRVMQLRYSPADWNIYAAQASNGDNAPGDNDRTADLLLHTILPACQYYAYLEVGQEGGIHGFHRAQSSLWQSYEALRDAGAPIALKRVQHRREIYPIFRELFQKREAVA